jgi:hypothetical protein
MFRPEGMRTATINGVTFVTGPWGDVEPIATASTGRWGSQVPVHFTIVRTEWDPYERDEYFSFHPSLVPIPAESWVRRTERRADRFYGMHWNGRPCALPLFVDHPLAMADGW